MIEVKPDDGTLPEGYFDTINGIQWYKLPSPPFVCGEFGAHKLTCGHHILDLKYLLRSNPSTTSPCGLNCTTCSFNHEAWKCPTCVAEVKDVLETKLTVQEKMKLDEARKAGNKGMMAVYTTEFVKKYTEIEEAAELVYCVLDEKYGRSCEVGGEPEPVRIMGLEKMLEKITERNKEEEGKVKEKDKEKAETSDAGTPKKANPPPNPPITPNNVTSPSLETDSDIPIQHPNEQPSRSLAHKRPAHFDLPPSPLLVERAEKKRKPNPRLRLGDAVRWNGFVGQISERKRALAIEAGDEEHGGGGWDAAEARDRERARKKMVVVKGDGVAEFVSKKVGEWDQDDYPVDQKPLGPVYYEEDEIL
ncbi:hypothetical protein BCR34DRAFT_597724 [Clohesyomyces aquaticus]|uniref:Uncharacterized protein n=1 Tax=Clohesyomyces aquaticus TaxID=1231657 RepID=A0A1Y2A1N2_9PLEO|nr:hypothetical protein BCR34DRAFT_597724 [Clohesyomyces aquaticus]